MENDKALERQRENSRVSNRRKYKVGYGKTFTHISADFTPEEAQELKEIAQELKMTKTQIILKGFELLKKGGGDND